MKYYYKQDGIMRVVEDTLHDSEDIVDIKAHIKDNIDYIKETWSNGATVLGVLQGGKIA